MPQNDRPVKCPGCGSFFKRTEEEFEYIKNRYWHKKCLINQYQQQTEKDKLLKYVEQLLHKKIDYKINNQLNNYIEIKKYTYKDIYNALYYFFDIKGNSIAKANGGIGIVPYVINEAKDYFQQKKIIASKIQDIDPIVDTKIVTIKDPTKKSKYKINRIINISEI